MGADLITIIAKGPRRIALNDRQEQAALDYLRRAAVFAKALHSHPEFDSGVFWEGDWQQIPVEVKNAVGDAFTESEWQHLSEHWVPYFCEKFEARAEVILTECVEWWNGCDKGRDVVVMVDPDDSNKLIVCAGGTSWGYPPAGRGYKALSLMVHTGLDRFLGVRSGGAEG